MKKIHQTKFEIFYEDTDSSGFTYHTSYLKFAERARSQFVRENLEEIKDKMISNSFFFVVREIKASFLKPTFLYDQLDVKTFFLKNHPTGQKNMNQNTEVATAKTTAAASCCRNSKHVQRPLHARPDYSQYRHDCYTGSSSLETLCL